MEIVTNDMIPDGKFKNKYEAIKSIRECLKMLTEIRNKTSFVKLSASANVFRGMELAEGYYFEQLFNENIELLPQKDKALLRTLLVNLYTGEKNLKIVYGYICIKVWFLVFP